MAAEFYQILQRLANNKHQRALFYLDQNTVKLHTEDICSRHSTCCFTRGESPSLLQWGNGRAGEWEECLPMLLFPQTELSLPMPSVPHTLLSVYFHLDIRQQGLLFKVRDPQTFIHSFKKSWYSPELMLKYLLNCVYYLPLCPNSNVAFPQKYFLVNLVPISTILLATNHFCTTLVSKRLQHSG